MTMRGLPRAVAALVLTTLVVTASASAQTAELAAPRLALMDPGDGSAANLIAAAGPLPIRMAVRLQTDNPADPAVVAQLDALERRGIPVWLAVQAPASSEAVDPWRRMLEALADRRRSTLAVLEVDVDAQPPAVATFAVQGASTSVRARNPDVRIAIGGTWSDDGRRRAEIYNTSLAPYVDLAVTTGDRAPAVRALLRDVDRDAKLALIDANADAGTGGAATRRVVDDVLTDAGTDVVLRAWSAPTLDVASLQALKPLAPLLTADIEPLDAPAAQPSLTLAGRDVTASVRHRLLFDTREFATFLVYWGDAASDPLRVALTLPVEGTPAVHDVLTGTRQAASGYTRDRATGATRIDVPLTGRPMLVDFNEDATEMAVERGDVTAERQLAVEEIIARHQQAQATQDALVQSYIATARMRQHFRPTVTDPGYDVVTENRYFVEGTAVEWEELSFAVNGSKWEHDRPPFPLLQPEKVLSLPLQLKFDEGYRYTLEGTERVDGFNCYAVRFEPVRRDAGLYRGTVYIDRRTFARIRVHAVQSGLAAPVVSNDETLRYVPATPIGNTPVFLFGGMTARQIVLVAGRNLLIEKEVTFRDFRINDTAFQEERAAARLSDRIMYRETERGLRYLVKQGGERVVSETLTSSVKAAAMGVYVDPSYAFPLPIFGINYLNFGLGSSDKQQLAVLFGGVLAAGNVQRSKLGSTPLDASVDFFAIAVPSSDRVFTRSGEAKDQRVLTWPMSTGLNLGWQASPYQKATFQYQLRFDAYVRDRTTAEAFQPPSSTLTNGFGGAWEYRRGGYQATANGTWLVRSRWNDWGPDGARVSGAGARTYVKYGAGLSRTQLLGPFQTLYFNGNWFGGQRLDRFVQYQFGMFDDTRIHGIPSAGVRFDDVGMVRGTYSLNIFEQYRLDLFLEHAWGHDDGDSWQRIPAIGAAVNFRAFWNTILRVEGGHSVLPSRYNGLGSTTVQILLLKPLR